LREQVRVLLKTSQLDVTSRQVEDLLDQARIAISETARSQYTRHLMVQADVANQVEQMAAQFLAAQNADEIFQVLVENLPGIGIQHAAVALYEPQADDPVAWSVLQTPLGLRDQTQRFPTRRFPPEGLYDMGEPFSLALVPMQVQEGVSGFVAFDTGNLEPCAAIVRQLAAALRSIWLYQEAVQGRRLAEEANRLKSRFLSVVSHELRTPLNLIIGVSDLLLQEARQAGPAEWEVSREDVERIYVSAQHLDGLIRDVLDLARSEAGQLRLVCEPLDLAEVLEVVAAIGEQLAKTKGLVWRTEIPDDLPHVWGDRTRLRQVALNLVNNAIKFTTRGEIVLTAAAEDDGVTVAVRDTGLGIPLKEQTVIFDEFRQSERTTARGYGGLGLGLAICKRLVEMHGGRIGVLSLGKEGAGSTFYFTLPAMQRRPLVADSAVSVAQAQQVLLLVKDASGGDLLKEHLVAQGFEVEVHQVDETTDWLAWLLAGPPEAVVLDLGLASERGWEVLKTLKEHPATQGVPVLFYSVTGDADSGSVLEIDFLTKPVGTRELVEALQSRGLLHKDGDRASGRKILIVDDEPDVLETHVRLVGSRLPDAKILRARNGWEALEVMRRELPDLVILDLMMPELDGFGMLEAMREDGNSRNIPVIVLTGQVLTQEDMARLNRGVASVLGKDIFSVEETLQHVQATLEHRRKLGDETQRIVRKALAYMHEHYAESISRGDVASYVGLSESHLTRCFREEMGVTPVTYLNRYRVRQAKALLEAGVKSITEVALEVGFSDSHYFARVFRREVGVSPSAFRQRVR
jgi:signal transduction histidine kinase/DNA-binding response OmpR family regulator